MKLQEYFSKLCKEKATLCVQWDVEGKVMGRIICSEDDYIILKVEGMMSKEVTVIPHSAIRIVEHS